MLAWLVLVGALMGNASHVLDVPYRNQLDGSRYAGANCGPTSLAMVLAYYGTDDSLWDLRVRAMKAQHSWTEDEGGYSDRYGVFVYNLATVAEEMGLRVNGLWHREGARVDALHQWPVADVRREILLDHPVILQVAYRALPRHAGSLAQEDHFIVVHGVLDDGSFVYSDPLGVGNRGPDEEITASALARAMDLSSTPNVGFAALKP